MDAAETEKLSADESKKAEAEVLMLLTSTILSCERQGSNLVALAMRMKISPQALLIICDLIRLGIHKAMPELKENHELLVPSLESVVKSGVVNVLKGAFEVLDEGGVGVAEFAFQPGRIEITKAVRQKVSKSRITECLTLFGSKDWGPFVDEAAKKTNDENVAKGSGTIYGIYRIYDARQDDDYDNKLYIVSAPDRSETKVLLPEEY
jgi:hypothetical protein